MPTFKITSPEGQTYRINAPEGATKAQAAQMLMKQLGKTSVPAAKPVDPKQAAAEALAKEQGPLDTALIGAGRGFTELGRGVKQLLGFDVERSPAEERAYAALQDESPITTALGESAPFLAGAGAGGVAMKGAQLGARLAGQAGIGATLGGAMPGTLLERAQRAGIEGALGAGGELVGSALGRVLAPRLRPAVAAANTNADDAAAAGLRVLPSTRVGPGAGNFRNVIEGGLESMPGSGGQMAKVTQDNAAALNRIATRALGNTVDDAPTGDVLAAARAEMGETFNRLMSKERAVKVPASASAALDDIVEEGISPFIRGSEDPIGRAVDRTREVLASPTLNAKDLFAQQSLLGKQAAQAFSGANSNPALGHALRDIQDLLLDTAERSLPEAEKELFRTTRGRWKVLRDLETGQVTNEATGEVSAPRLASLMGRKNPRGFKEGGDKSDLATATKFLGRNQRKNQSSGTAERLALGTLMGGGGGVVGSVVGGDEHGALTGLGGIATGLLAPNLMARAYLRSGARSMPNIFTRGAGTTEDALTRMLGIGGAQTLGGNEEGRLLRELEGGR